MIHNTALPAVIEKIQSRVKAIKPDPDRPEDIMTMETISLMLGVINSYAAWITELKIELNKCAERNRSQAEVIRSKGIIT